MNKKVKAKWLEALRSGKYKQTKSMLMNPTTNGHCCLGVLCDLYAKEVGGSFDENGQFHDNKGNVGDGTPPDDVVKWAKLPDENPSVKGKYSKLGSVIDISLAELNDDGRRFSTIANIIEKEL